MIKIDLDQCNKDGQQDDLPKDLENRDSCEDALENVETVVSDADIDLASLQETFCNSLTLSVDTSAAEVQDDCWSPKASCDKPSYSVTVTDPALQLISSETYPTKIEMEQKQLISALQHSSSWQHYDQAEQVSGELVSLLQERQRLRDEVAIRNIAIEQLLKLQEKLQWRLTEPLAVQMSVVFPPDENEALDCT